MSSYLQHGRRHMPTGSDPIPGQPSPVGVTVDTFYLDATAGATSTVTLSDGARYLITIQGTYSLWNKALDEGSPEADAMFHGSSGGRLSTQVGCDADTLFAYPHDSPNPIGHSDTFQIDLGGGFAHIEPDDGAHSVPVDGHLYKYTVTGQGSTVSFRLVDSPLSDNYGQLLIVIQALDGTDAGGGGPSGGGGGSGSLVPPADTTNNAEVLTVVGGIASWAQAAVKSVFGRTGNVVAVNGDYAGVLAAFLTGATQATRYVGATISGAPVSGTFQKGDFVVAQDGHVFVCTTAGSPGTWTDVGGGGSGGAVSSVFTRTGAVVAVNGDYAGVLAAFLTGATQASRYVGATTSGAPVSGTFQKGDYVIAQNGHIFICTTAGSPGTWTDVAAAAGTISSITSTGGSITVGSPSGPTTNVDVATSGVTAATYGDGSHVPQIHVGADGRITSASSVAITGGSGTIGFELDYVQRTTNVTVSGTSGAQTTVLTGTSLSYDGSTRVKIEFFAPVLEVGAGANNFVAVELWDGSTDLCELAGVSNSSGSITQDVPGAASIFLTPSAGSHQFIVKAYKSAALNNGLVAAGTGSGAGFAPAFLRITKA